MLVKTDKPIEPIAELPCPNCQAASRWVGIAECESEKDIWHDWYRCPQCAKRFTNNNLVSWYNPDTATFYAYQETADAS